MAPARTAEATALTIVRTVAHVVRLSAAVVPVLTLAVALTGDLTGTTVPPVAMWTAVVTVTLLGVAVLRTDVVEALRTGRRRGLVEAFPVVMAIELGAVQVAYGTVPTARSAQLAVLVLTVFAARTPTLALVLALSVGMDLVGTARAGTPDWTGAVAFAAASGYLTWVARILTAAFASVSRQQAAARRRAEDRAEEVATVADVARDIQALAPTEVLQRVADATGLLGWDVCGLYTPASDDRGWVLGGHRGIADDIAETSHEQRGAFGLVMESGETVVIDDYAEHPRHNRDYPDLRTVVGCPVVANGEVLGALVVGRTRRQLDPADVRLVELLADQAGRAVEVAQQFVHQQEAMAELERVNALKQDIVATVSHELRTPLQVVLGMAETLDVRWDAMDDTRRHQLVSRVHRSSVELQKVVEVLLDFSRLEAGHLTARSRPVDLASVAQRVVERVAGLHPGHLLEVVMVVGGVPRATGDGDLLERVVENLVVNACRHTSPGTRVTVDVTVGPEVVRLRVADDGPGIASEDLARLGERFFRGGGDHLRRTSRGVGLGLAFCKEVLELHGSDLEVRTSPGDGASFAFSLPRALDADVPAEAPQDDEAPSRVTD